MPAGSEAALPVTFRPLGVRLAIYVLGALLLVVVAVMWLSFPAATRAEFSILQRATIVGFGVLFYGAGFALARSRVVARESGLTVVNGYRTRRFEWNEILAVSLRPGSPWAVLDLSDGTSVAAMGIQSSDGARAAHQVRQVRALVNAHTR
jgi:hypothetical protein